MYMMCSKKIALTTTLTISPFKAIEHQATVAIFQHFGTGIPQERAIFPKLRRPQKKDMAKKT
jgi:hypothetical protein